MKIISPALMSAFTAQVTDAIQKPVPYESESLAF